MTERTVIRFVLTCEVTRDGNRDYTNVDKVGFELPLPPQYAPSDAAEALGRALAQLVVDELGVRLLVEP